MLVVKKLPVLLRKRSRYLRQSCQRGMTLIEILVTMVILAIGLLGLAALMVEGLRNNQSAYLRTQASIYAYDMADRMRINRDRAIAGDYDSYTTSGVGAVTTSPTCASSTSGCSPAAQVTLDKAEWTRAITGTNGIALLPDGVGTISRGAGNEFTITLSWEEAQWDDDEEKEIVDTRDFSLQFSL